MIEQEFFTVVHSLTSNIEPLDESFLLPDDEDFIAEIPVPFVVASEFSQLEQLADTAKQELKSRDLKSLVNLLDSQNRKLNLLLNFMLSQQNEPSLCHQTVSFGASQFTYTSDTPVATGTRLRVKLFLDYPPSAIYCYAEVESCQQEGSYYSVKARYVRLRDSDQDLLIKAALYQQQKLLRQRSVERDND
ncbi:hypothetical protein VA7868_00999 [Vibrio aerogenes CECT 7868]|uniref:PilZ domain-containing protein n=1 Tax=Vibrio aerogenes CECT 7868 TaxID=1216006 RepID=A0A1M5X667_9VIBR|nr:PilZ domain-containing protein [Vibrio aerogenes]SHH95276.1 hypothetical protein VA7868_00999 [Vibrio aerogenes CECT 7868]